MDNFNGFLEWWYHRVKGNLLTNDQFFSLQEKFQKDEIKYANV